MTHRANLIAVTLSLLLILPTLADAQDPERPSIDPVGLQRLEAEAGGPENVSVRRATGTPRFVRLGGATRSLLTRQAAPSSDAQLRERSMAFFRQHASVFGLGNPDVALRALDVQRDSLGGTHLAYAQVHRDVPVFAGLLKAHFNSGGDLTAVSASAVPNITVDPKPAVGSDAAAGAALAIVLKGGATNLGVRGTRLYVYRTGLAQGIEGQNHLAWEVEIGDGGSNRELVYVDAHSGITIDRVSGINDALDRRVYDNFANYPAMPFWVEGQTFPTASVEANNVIAFSGDAYNFYSRTFGRDSFDGAGGTMHGIFNASAPGLCPNAFWNGVYTAYCAGVTPDDVVAHEWTHAYTQYTHNLIYAWQPGALNESYSDIYGEIVDLLNGAGTDSPGTNRTADTCSAFGSFPPVLRVNSPAVIAGTYPAGGAAFGPPLTAAGLTGNLVLAIDGVAPANDGCTPLTNGAAIAGNIAVIDRGTCPFVVKVKNAQDAGAIGAVIVNAAGNGDAIGTMGGVDPTITISSVLIGFTNGNLIKPHLATGVNATMRIDEPATTDNSYRWLIAEDATAFGGAIRDMWTPTCFGDPGKVSDTQYACGTGDAGGVHSNSGVPNHGFALLVDGGTYNGRTIASIGAVRAAHVYYRAMTVYQGPASDFSDHADALEQSCSDLIGMPLTGFDGSPSGQSITASDCSQVEQMALAVELRTPPTQCNFQPVLSQNPPDRCEAGTTQVNIFRDKFETNPMSRWAVSHENRSTSFTDRDWQWANTLPDRSGSAFFGPDPNIGACTAASDETGVLHLDGPAVTLKSGVVAPRLTFDHRVATEAAFDGGQLKVSVGAGPWQMVAREHFTFNPYNSMLASAQQGNSNPMAGQFAFNGTDGGSVTGTWGRSHVNLASYVKAGESFRLRFDMGTDGCGGVEGWYVDDVTVYTCTSNTKPTVSINDVAVTEGNSGLTKAVFTVRLSHAVNKPVTVYYQVKPGTAREGSDYVVRLRDHDDHHGRGRGGEDDDDDHSGRGRDGDDDHGDGHHGRGHGDHDNDHDTQSVVIPPLSISAEIVVYVVGDRQHEPNETFFVRLKSARDATIGDGSGTGTIVNDDAGHRR